jgi:hypothetical protein
MNKEGGGIWVLIRPVPKFKAIMSRVKKGRDVCK